MSWMKRIMGRFGPTETEPQPAVMSPAPEQAPPVRLAEGTGERERPTFRRVHTIGEEPLLYSDFEDTVYDLRPSELILDLRTTGDDTIDEVVEDQCKTIPGWSPDPDVISSACSHRPVTSASDRIQCHSPFRRRSALERLLDPNLRFAEPFTPIP